MSHLSDDELLTGTRRLVGASNKLSAQLLLHLAEVEARGIHRTRACASLYTYCIYELRLSEDAAARRSSAARLVKRFPLLFHAVASGELHLTGLLMLGPHLTPENHVEVLARAKFRTKRELTKLVRELCPLPVVPDLMQPLGPEGPRSLREPTWEEWVTSLCPPVRDLKPGDAPRDWANDAASGATDDDAFTAPASLARCELPPITPPQQYQMQFSTTEEHVRLVERARGLLARSASGVSLGELHRQAMQLLVERLERERFAATRPRKAKRPVPRNRSTTRPAQLDEQQPRCETPGRGSVEPPTPAKPAPRQRGRYVPAAVKREVFTRDGGCCSYVDERGQRCREMRYLELHHLKPFAQGGEHVASNLTLRCAAHNALAAEEDFGRAVIEQQRHATRHDSLAAQARLGPALGS